MNSIIKIWLAGMAPIALICSIMIFGYFYREGRQFEEAFDKHTIIMQTLSVNGPAAVFYNLPTRKVPGVATWQGKDSKWVGVVVFDDWGRGFHIDGEVTDAEIRHLAGIERMPNPEIPDKDVILH